MVKFGEKQKSTIKFGNKKPIFKLGKKVRDVLPIKQATKIFIKSKDELKSVVEEPCLRVCEFLFDRNIETVDSGCNGENSSHRAYVTINYDTLSNENKLIADNLVRQGKFSFYPKGDSLRNYFNQVEIDIPITPDDFVVNVENKLLSLAKNFKQQEKIKQKEDSFFKMKFFRNNRMSSK